MSELIDKKRLVNVSLNAMVCKYCYTALVYLLRLPKFAFGHFGGFLYSPVGYTLTFVHSVNF